MPKKNVPLKPVREEDDSEDDDGVPMEAPFSPTDEFEVIGSMGLKDKSISKLNNSMLNSQDSYDLGPSKTKNTRASMNSSGLNSSVLIAPSGGMGLDLSPQVKKKINFETPSNKMAQSVMGGRPAPRQSHNVLSQSMDFGSG